MSYPERNRSRSPVIESVKRLWRQPSQKMIWDAYYYSKSTFYNRCPTMGELVPLGIDLSDKYQVEYYQKENFVRLLRNHFGSLLYSLNQSDLMGSYVAQYFLGGAPYVAKYQEMLKKAGIRSVLEIGPGAQPLAYMLRKLTGNNMKITYLGPDNNVRLNIREGDQDINGNFPLSLPKDQTFDLVLACGVFSAGGQGGNFDATTAIAQMSQALSDNPNAVAINMSKIKPTVSIDLVKLERETYPFFVNDRGSRYFDIENGMITTDCVIAARKK
jgi:hypothetical protein